MMSEFSEDGNERVTFAGNGSGEYVQKDLGIHHSCRTSSSRTLKGAEPVLFITSSLFPVDQELQALEED